MSNTDSNLLRLYDLEAEYDKIRHLPQGVESLRKWEVCRDIAKGIVRTEYASQEPLWESRAEHYSFEVVGLWLPLCGNEEFRKTVWTLDRKESMSLAAATKIRDERLAEGVEALRKGKKGRPTKAVTKHREEQVAAKLVTRHKTKKRALKKGD